MPDQKNTTVTLSGNIDISGISDLKIQFDNLLANECSITINAKDVNKIDTPSLQMLCVIESHLKNQNNTLNWEPASDAIIKSASLLGISDFLNLPNTTHNENI